MTVVTPALTISLTTDLGGAVGISAFAPSAGDVDVWVDETRSGSEPVRIDDGGVGQTH